MRISDRRRDAPNALPEDRASEDVGMQRERGLCVAFWELFRRVALPLRAAGLADALVLLEELILGCAPHRD
jgi:hypothetical protein